MEESLSKSFDFADVARKSVASTKYITSVKPQNGNSFTLGGSVVEFALPTAVQRSFAMLNGAYIKFRVRNNSGVDFSADGSAGFASVINRMEFVSSGGILSSIANWNSLYSALMDLGADPATSGNVLNPLFGTAQSPAEVTASVNSAAAAFSGAEIPTAGGTTDRTVCVPLVLNPFSACDRGIPLFSADNLRIRMTLESAAAALISAGAVADSQVVIDQVSLNFETVTLDQASFDLVDASTVGVYNILSTDWRCVSNNVAAGVTSATNIIGVSVSSAKRLLILPRNTVDITNLAAASQANRTMMNLSQVQLNCSGKLLPQLPVTIEPATDRGRGAEALATTLMSDDKLGDIKAGGLLSLGSAAGTQLYTVTTAAAGTNATDSGKFMLGIDLRTHPEGDDVFSGLNLLGANFLADFQMSAAVPVAATLLYCVQFHSLISLDTRSTNTFRVSV